MPLPRKRLVISGPLVAEFRHVTDPVLGKRTLLQLARKDGNGDPLQGDMGNLVGDEPIYFVGHLTLDEVRRRLKEV